MMPRPMIPPTTPPAIAPVLLDDLWVPAAVCGSEVGVPVLLVLLSVLDAEELWEPVELDWSASL